MYGSTLTIPGDLAGADLQPDSDLQNLLHRLRKNAARPPVQTAHHGTQSVHLPENLDQVSHVYVRRGKTTPLGKNYDGPFLITKRLGTSSVQVRVGAYAGTGDTRYETHHWNNCKIAHFYDEPFEATRPALGRKSAAQKLPQSVAEES